MILISHHLDYCFFYVMFAMNICWYLCSSRPCSVAPSSCSCLRGLCSFHQGPKKISIARAIQLAYNTLFNMPYSTYNTGVMNKSLYKLNGQYYISNMWYSMWKVGCCFWPFFFYRASPFFSVFGDTHATRLYLYIYIYTRRCVSTLGPLQLFGNNENSM